MSDGGGCVSQESCRDGNRDTRGWEDVSLGFKRWDGIKKLRSSLRERKARKEGEEKIWVWGSIGECTDVALTEHAWRRRTSPVSNDALGSARLAVKNQAGDDLVILKTCQPLMEGEEIGRDARSAGQEWRKRTLLGCTWSRQYNLEFLCFKSKILAYPEKR